MTDLAKTEPFWESWFVGLSKKFLEARGGKLLLLAGTDRLDKELMIGQMQGIDTTSGSPLGKTLLILNRQISTSGLPRCWPFYP